MQFRAFGEIRLTRWNFEIDIFARMTPNCVILPTFSCHFAHFESSQQIDLLIFGLPDGILKSFSLFIMTRRLSDFEHIFVPFRAFGNIRFTGWNFEIDILGRMTQDCMILHTFSCHFAHFESSQQIDILIFGLPAGFLKSCHCSS